MNRIEYMRKLASLLQDVPVKERVAAMQYYNDYFDDAGEENESQVIEELGSPEQVAAEMKAGLGRQAEESGEFRETGYTDTQFERKDVPVSWERPSGRADSQAGAGQGESAYRYAAGSQDQHSGRQGTQDQPWTSKGLKVALIILILLVVVPVLGPFILVIGAVVCALAVSCFAIFIALVAAAAALAVSGIAVFIRGVLLLVPDTAVALAAMGTGMILTVTGVIAVVAAVRLCIIVLPGLFRFFVNLCRRPFQKRKERG